MLFRSKHPIAQAIRKGAAGPRPKAFVMQSKAVPGRGVQVQLSDGTQLSLGSYAWMKQLGWTNGGSDALHDQLVDKSLSLSWLAIGNKIACAFGVQDPLKPESSVAIDRLHQLGIETTILSGDQSKSVQQVAQALHIDHWVGEQTPEDKGRRVEEHRRQGKHVAFVGDGINDAPALANADVGIAMGNGTDIAISAADVVLASGFTPRIPLAIELARAVMANIYQNLFWAFAYNLLLIPLAAGWLSPWTSWTFSPMLAAVAMGLSSLLVVGNALRLRRFQAPCSL